MTNPVQHDLTYLEQLADLGRSCKEVEYAGIAVLRDSGKQVSVRVPSRRYGHEWKYVVVRKEVDLGRDAAIEDVEKHELTVPACLEEGLAGPETVEWYESSVSDRDVAAAACRESEAIYNAAPWARYWLVTSSDGHIHASRHCHTCNKGHAPTGFALVPYLSGRPVEDAVADLGPALCTACYPSAPVESREQARFSSKLALCLAEEGCEAFQKARKEAKAKAAARCPGSGQIGLPGSHRGCVKCPSCGDQSRALSNGKVRPHKSPRFYVENDDYKAWNGSGWGPATKAAIYATTGEAESVAAAVGGRIRRK